MYIRIIEKINKTNLKNPIFKKLTGGKKNYWYCCKPVILSHDTLGYLKEVKRFLPKGEVSEFELEIAKKLFLQGEEPKAIVGELISIGCCRF